YRADGAEGRGIWTADPGGIPVALQRDRDPAEELAVFHDGKWNFFDYETVRYAGGVITAPPAGEAAFHDPWPSTLDLDGDGISELGVLDGNRWHFYDIQGRFLETVVGVGVDERPVSAV